MAKRLAITISGAVSLGSYEAGVIYEILRALSEHNRHPDTIAHPETRIDVDVLTGASAGGMTAAIAAQVILGGDDRMVSAADNAFYRPWVQEVDLAELLRPDDQDDPPDLSILASSFVEQIAHENLPSHVGGLPHATRSPAGVRLGLAMSNLNGIDYGTTTLNAHGSGKFTYTRFQDEFRWRIATPAAFDWTPVREAALACGAFPLAFRARSITRTAADYPDPGVDPANFANGPREMTYLDGGIFQNEPLGLAKDLVDELDCHRDVDNRFYLFVAPGAKTGAAAGSDKISAANETMLKASKDLVKSLFWQSRFHDWIMAEKTSHKIHLLNRRAAQLAAALLADSALANQLDAPLTALLALSYSGDNEQLARDVSLLAEQFARLNDAAGIEHNYAAELGPQRAHIWLRGILLLERVAGLENKDEMEIYTITSEEGELGGDPLFAFAGFIDRSIRQHDYDVGRQKAREWLLAQSGRIFPIRASFAEALNPIDPALGQWKLAQFDPNKREQLRARLRGRAKLLLKEAGLNSMLRFAADEFFIKGKVKELLEL